MFAIGVQFAPAFVDDSHLTTSPMFPVRVSVPLFEVSQTVVSGATMVRPSYGIIVTVTPAEFVHPFATVPVTV